MKIKYTFRVIMDQDYEIPYPTNDEEVRKIGENIARQVFRIEPNFKYVELAGFEVKYNENDTSKNQ